jgi:hypothetical protein
MSKKKDRKPVKYTIIRFKLTRKQKKSLDNYSRMRGSTSTKVIKKQLRPLLENYADIEIKTTFKKASQLQLFDMEGQES